jgi:hypothetical protein
VSEFVALIPGSASAAATTALCVPTTENSAVKTPLNNGTCVNTKNEKFHLTELQNKLPLSEDEVKTLQGILPCIKSVKEGIDKKPTVQFSGCNVQVVNGMGETKSTNGAGNLVIGYDENREDKRQQTGSHNLILGEEQTFTSYGGMVAGLENTISGPLASVLSGVGSTASGERASVTGGYTNDASGDEASIAGGYGNRASIAFASVGGGEHNEASGFGASVSGGVSNTASNFGSSVGGGRENNVTGEEAWIGGGDENTASAIFASIFGSKELEATQEFEAIP